MAPFSTGKWPHSRQEKPIDKTLCTCYNTRELTEKFPILYRGVEQLEARRAHNPEVVGSSPASATKICPETMWFLDFFFCFAGLKFGFLDVDFLGLGVDPCFDP